MRDFQDACDQFEARVTYFVDHAVLENDDAASVVQQLSTRNDIEIGFHLHPWNTPPLGSTDTIPERESFLHNLPRDFALAKMDTVLQSFRRRGLSPTSFRGGRYSTSDWIQDHLYANGCIADASVLPFTTWVDDGAPDFRDRDLAPRRRDMGDGKPGLWEIPLTLAFTRSPWSFWRRFYEVAEKTPLRQLKCVGIAERLFINRIWLNLEHPLGESLTSLLPVLRKAELPCINFTMHSSSLVPGLNSYTRSPADLRRLYQRLHDALSLLRTWPEFRPATITEVAQHLEKQHYACTRN